MKRHFFVRLFTLIAVLCGMSACTTVELCPEVEHPHVANVRASFNWGNVNKADIPGEINIVASRIINTWRTYGVADTSKDPVKEDNISYRQSTSELLEAGEGATRSFYLRGGEYNIFAINNQRISVNAKDEGTEGEGTDGGNTDDEGEGTDDKGTDVANTKGEGADVEGTEGEGTDSEGTEGEGTDSEGTEGEGEGTSPAPEPETPEEAAIEIENLDNYINDTQTKVSDLYLHIKSMGDKKPDIVGDNDLPDFNPNYEYLENITAPIYHAVKKGVNINTGQETIIDFDMQRVSLGVNIIFKIQLKANSSGERVSVDDLDSPIVELSGICGRFNISEAYLDTTKLYRMAQKIVKPKNKQDMEPAAGEDGKRQDFVKESEDTYRCTARFNTLGVIPSSSKNHLNGSGIVQVAVRVWSDVLDDQGNKVLDEEGNPKRTGRYVYAGINIRDELMAERLVEVRDGKTYMRYSKDDVNVEVNLPLIIEKDKIVPDDSGMGWIPFDPTDPDGDIDIEI